MGYPAMTTGGFEPELAKVRWSEHHLDLVRDCIADYLGSNPYMAVVDRQEEAQAYQIHAHLRREPPIRLGLHVGDFLANLRASLDHLIWQLALIDGRRPPDRELSFPIMQKWPEGRRDVIRLPISGRVPGEALAFIASKQPYHKGDRFREDPLWVLDELNNIAKHRHLTLMSAVGRTRTTWRIDSPFGWSMNSDESYVVQDGAEVGLVPFSSTGESPVDMNIKVSTRVTADEIGEAASEVLLVDLLESLLGYVKTEILAGLVHLFPEPHKV